MKRPLGALALFLSLFTLELPAQIPILTTDASGNEVATLITEADYGKLLSLEAETMAIAAADQFRFAPEIHRLFLDGVLLGLEAQGNLGIGPFKFGAGINQQFYFKLRN